MAMMCAEHRLGHVVGVDADLVVARSQIQLGEEKGPMQFIQELLDDGDRELILHRGRVERAVVHTEAPGPVLLLDKNHLGCKGL